MTEGSASVVIDRPASDVWATLTDITRMGEWSPECVAGRWVGGATGPAVDAEFEGDNALRLAGRTLKRWTTTSRVTVCDVDTTFEFVAEGYTTWRYDLARSGAGTRVTESFRYVGTGFQGFVYNTLLRRRRAMIKGMQRTLQRLREHLEARP